MGSSSSPAELSREKQQKRAAMFGFPQSFVRVREPYAGACTTIRVAVMVKVPLMLGGSPGPEDRFQPRRVHSQLHSASTSGHPPH